MKKFCLPEINKLTENEHIYFIDHPGIYSWQVNEAELVFPGIIIQIPSAQIHGRMGCKPAEPGPGIVEIGHVKPGIGKGKP